MNPPPHPPQQNSLFLVSHLFVPLASASGVPDGTDHPGPSQRVVAQDPRPVAQVVAVRVRAGVRAGHGGDDGGLHHPLQVLAGGDCIDGGDEGTVGARHVDPVLLQQNRTKDAVKSEDPEPSRTSRMFSAAEACSNDCRHTWMELWMELWSGNCEPCCE